LIRIVINKPFEAMLRDIGLNDTNSYEKVAKCHSQTEQ
jgi:hypothetical protein